MEVAGFDGGRVREFNIAAEYGLDIGRRGGGDALLELSVPGELIKRARRPFPQRWRQIN